LLNILGKRADGFHELETVMHPVNLFDVLNLERTDSGINLTCSDASLPTDNKNLVYRAAEAFLKAAKVKGGVRIHLEKKIPLAAGLGGGSGNAATTLTALNRLFESPLSDSSLHELAAALGSDVPFFLQPKPALGTGRGEVITSLDFFPALSGTAFLLIHPGFGIASSWAYQQLANFPEARNGKAGRARELIELLNAGDLASAGKHFYNSLESPALHKYPILQLYQEFLRENGALAALMSGSGSTTFAIARNVAAAEKLAEAFRSKFGTSSWMAVVPV